LKGPQAENQLSALVESGHGFPDGKVVQPAAIRQPLIPDLVHHEDGVAAIVANGFKEGAGLLDGVQRAPYLFTGQLSLVAISPTVGSRACRLTSRSRTCKALYARSRQDRLTRMGWLPLR